MGGDGDPARANMNVQDKRSDRELMLLKETQWRVGTSLQQVHFYKMCGQQAMLNIEKIDPTIKGMTIITGNIEMGRVKWYGPCHKFSHENS